MGQDEHSTKRFDTAAGNICKMLVEMEVRRKNLPKGHPTDQRRLEHGWLSEPWRQPALHQFIPLQREARHQRLRFSRAECIGTIERQWSTTKAGERKWRVKYAKEPCGWSRGLKAKAKPKSDTTLRLGALARGETPVAEEAHNPEPTGRLVLNDYRSGF